jgi:hypothetical protein
MKHFYFLVSFRHWASEYYVKAFQLDTRQPTGKLAIPATYYTGVTGELDKAAQTYQEEIESYPREMLCLRRNGFC